MSEDEKNAKRDELEKKFEERLEVLKSELKEVIAPLQEAGKGGDTAALEAFLESDSLDEKLVPYVVLMEATPKDLAAYASQGSKKEEWVDQLLCDTELMKEMLLADGADRPRLQGKNNFGPPKYGPAMKILCEIKEQSEHATKAEAANGLLYRLALAVALEHAVKQKQDNPKDPPAEASEFIDPVRRYLNFEQAYLDGELDPAFDQLTTWDLRHVINGDEPDETEAWGRTMLRNFRPNHVVNNDYAWRYSMVVRTEIAYGSGRVKYDRPELQNYQNILMNGGICGRRAFFGRFILRSFGIPTTARPSSGHGALCHWTPPASPSGGWVVNLGGPWGCGWTNTIYRNDLDFLATTKARVNRDEYWKVKRAQWAGDVMGEKRIFGEHEKDAEKNLRFWYRLSLKTQKEIIQELPKKIKTLKPFLDKPKIKTKIQDFIALSASTDAKKIIYRGDEILIPSAAFENPKQTKDVEVMKSFRRDGFDGGGGAGFQIYLPSFKAQGLTIMRGGAFKSDPPACKSGCRLQSGGYGKYGDWGFRVAVSGGEQDKAEPLTLDLGELKGQCVTLELVYVPPGTFMMGGECKVDGRFECVEVPKHQVKLTHGFYLGKYPVTQEQYEAVMGSNPSKSTKAPDCPVDNIGESDAEDFCNKLVDTIGRDIRLPTEAEWEYASRAGADTKWFFGDDPSSLGEYAWFKGNSGGKSHPVGKKKPNPWGLYDMYGNVLERVSDKYAKNYYEVSPPEDPTGPCQGCKSCFEYKVKVEKSGTYSLTAEIVTVNYDQRLTVVANGKGCDPAEEEGTITIELPFTCGSWQTSTPVTVELKEGVNSIRFWRDKPPQYALAIKGFTLKLST